MEFSGMKQKAVEETGIELSEIYIDNAGTANGNCN